jgi:hypothetical protein
MIKYLLVLFILILGSDLNAQNWLWARSSTAGAGSGTSVATDLSGNIYITGYYDDGQITFGSETLTYAGQSDSYLVKYDPNGNVLWARNIGSVCGDFANAVCTDNNGNVFVTGFFCSASLTIGSFTLNGYGGAFSIFLAKYDSNGNVLWARTADGTVSCDNYSYGVATDNNGNCFITGNFSSVTLTFGSTVLTNSGTPGSIFNLFIAKYDAAGNILWAKKAGGADYAKSFAICTDLNGNAFITGSYRSSSINFDGVTLINSGSYDSYLTKYSPNGTVLWAKGTTCTRDDEGKSISCDPAGNIYQTGYFSSPTIVFGSTTLTNTYPLTFYDNMYLVKYQNDGTVLWSRNAGGSNTSGGSSEYGYAVSAYNNGVFVTGEFRTPSLTFGSFVLTPVSNTNSPMFITHYNASGDVVYATFLESGGTIRNSVKLDNTSNVYVTSSFTFSAVPFSIGSQTLPVSGINTTFLAKLGNTFTLPVNITRFQVSALNDQANLIWDTESEINISSYEVQRSTNTQGGFQTIGSIRANGRSSNSYQFEDKGLSKGMTYYYRLVIVETDGSKSYSAVRKIRINGVDLADIRFNNPTDGMLNLQFQNITGKIGIKIINEAGQIVYKMNKENVNAGNLLINIQHIPDGIYWLQADHSGETLVKKLVKQ